MLQELPGPSQGYLGFTLISFGPGLTVRSFVEKASPDHAPNIDRAIFHAAGSVPQGFDSTNLSDLFVAASPPPTEGAAKRSKNARATPGALFDLSDRLTS